MRLTLHNAEYTGKGRGEGEEREGYSEWRNYYRFLLRSPILRVLETRAVAPMNRARGPLSFLSPASAFGNFKTSPGRVIYAPTVSGIDRSETNRVTNSARAEKSFALRRAKGEKRATPVRAPGTHGFGFSRGKPKSRKSAIRLMGA